VDNEIELISDGDGIAVVGEPRSVEAFLRTEELWDHSRTFDLTRLRPLLAIGSEVAQTASDIAASSGRWLKLTPESARLVKEHGLMETDTPSVRHAMIGVPGRLKSWVQVEQGTGASVVNPDALAGAAGLMAQLAGQQNMAEITSYLERLDAKADDILAKVDDTNLKSLRGAMLQIQRAQTMRELEGRVTADAWSELQGASGKLADVQGYALLQLERIAGRLENDERIGKLAAGAEEAVPEVQRWLVVLAECFRQQRSFDVLVLDKAMDESPAAINARRRALEADRRDRLSRIAAQTTELLLRMGAAVGSANEKLLWARTKSLTIVNSGNDLARGVGEFHDVVGIDAETWSWEPKQLGRAEDLGSVMIQLSRDGARPALTVAGLAITAAIGAKTLGQNDA
jgi:hypothetical protein